VELVCLDNKLKAMKEKKNDVEVCGAKVYV
jgi:hypothetical protein